MIEFTIFSKGKAFTVTLDEEDYCKVAHMTWWLKPTGYVYTQTRGRKNRTSIYLHRLITGASKGQEIDHINRNPLDNRKENLRFCTRSQNNMNKAGLRGVSPFKRGWRARIKKDRKEIHIGLYATKEAAVEARLKAEKELFSNFAPV